jgi:hypothetical protein
MAKINEETEITIPLKNLIALVCGVAVGVWGYFELDQRLNFIERETMVMQSSVDQNTDFRILWPRGELGSLPDDMMQNARIEAIMSRTIDLERWVNGFEPPEEVQDAVKRVRDLEKQVVELKIRLEEMKKDG